MDDMEFQNYFPVWNKLNTVYQRQILGTLITRTVKKGTVIHNGSNDCTGGELHKRADGHKIFRRYVARLNLQTKPS